MLDVKLMTLDPAHFHAALIHKEMLPGVSKRVHVFGPMGPDLIAHLNRLMQFNTRAANPTLWELEVHAAPDYFDRMLRQQPGNVVVLAGRNHRKIDSMLACVNAGLHVLADKPWIIRSADLPKIQSVFRAAELRDLVVSDIMTERFEITSILQRALVDEPSIFGHCLPGSATTPAVTMESIHAIRKNVSGSALRRPASFFDIEQNGEALADVGTHLADLVIWILSRSGSIDYQTDVRMIAGSRWPTELSLSDYRDVSGESALPPSVADQVKDDRFTFLCNNQVSFQILGIHVRLTIRWDYEIAAGDVHRASFQGSRSRIEVTQGTDAGSRPQLAVVPNERGDLQRLAGELERWTRTVRPIFLGLASIELPDRIQIQIPEGLRVGHEAHFGQVTNQFLRYLWNPRMQPAAEKPNLLAKYFITTAGVDLARRSAGGPRSEKGPR
jgi:predicted dehydrogenase